ncbi:MAG: dienelactone hydrolase family protein [Bryobacteraceae bacterium]
MSEMVQFNRPDGGTCSAWCVEPAAGSSAPGVVVIQEWWGLNDQIKGVAQRFADAGYRALVPDLYRGKVGVDAEEASHLMRGLNFGDAAGQDVRGAVQYLKQSSAKVGVTGYCMGGALTLLAAANVPESDAAVCWYGFPPLEYIDASKINAPLLGHFAEQDAFFPVAKVGELEDKLKAAGVAFEFHRYDARHAFANETAVNSPIATAYDAGCAALAWDRTLAFFGRHLKG